MSLILKALTAAILVALAWRAAPAQDTQATTRPVRPATALDGDACEVAREADLPQWVFWRRIRETAVAFAARLEWTNRSIDDPDHGAFVAGVLRRELEEACEKQPDFRSRRLSFGCADFDPTPPSPALATTFTWGESTHLLRHWAVHPDSPATEIADAPFEEESAWRTRGGAAPKVVLSTAPPNYETLAAAAAAGAAAWIVQNTPGTPNGSQYALPVEIAGAPLGERLPLPLVFVNEPCGIRMRDATAANRISLKVVLRQKAPSRRSAVSFATLKGDDSSRYIVVVSGRTGRGLSAEVASRTGALAVLVETARVLVAFTARTPQLAPLIDVVFVHVADGGATGFKFLRALGREQDLLMGVVAIDDVCPDEKDSTDLFLSFEASTQKSALERAFEGAAKRYAAKSGSWRSITHHRLAEALAPEAKALAQERVPIVRLTACAHGAPFDAYPPPLWGPGTAPKKSFPRSNELLGTPGDQIPAVYGESMDAAVVVARLMVVSLMRIARAKF